MTHPEGENDFDPDMHLILQMVEGEEVRMGRENSALFTFARNAKILGRTAMESEAEQRNHVFVVYGNDTERKYSYIFRASPVFQEIAQFMLTNDFPLHLNLPEVSETDEQAFQMSIDKQVVSEEEDLGDFVPDEWFDGNDAA